MPRNNIIRSIHIICLLAILTLSSGCDDRPWNNPYPASQDGQNTLYSEFSERPKHLDPIRSYSSNEYEIIAQVYEPVVQYHYLKRPYELTTLTATEVPHPVYLDHQKQPLPDDASVNDIAYSVYRINIKPGIMYQPHPAFVKDDKGSYAYHQLSDEQLDDINTLGDFDRTDARELVADDYVYQIKRLAHPRLHSPIFGVMAEYIVGLGEFAKLLEKLSVSTQKQNNNKPAYLDLNQHNLPGVKVLDKYTYEITIHGKYPQFVYWLAMPFFAPMPAEAEHFYHQPGLVERNITLDWYPIGTGPYMLTENNPNLRMVMDRNPNFHGETYPTEGEEVDKQSGLLKDAGKPMPFIDKVVHNLEKETIPYWNKFLQGYYDKSAISSDSFDQAVQFGAKGDASLTDEMKEKGIGLITAVTTSISYMGFNMLDKTVGGDSQRARKLRQAIAIALDFEEMITIFANGRGIPAHGPIPPGIFGNLEGEEGINPYIYEWNNGRVKRKSIKQAMQLMAEAGYPDGVDPKTKKPLLLYFDTAMPGPDAKAYLNWLRKQFQKLNIQLVIRNTDYNRFQEKIRKGTAQIYRWGWNADYPDPENFLFLLYGPNKKVGSNGENASNYTSDEFDRLFEKMNTMENSPERQSIINDMLNVLRRDSPWMFGYHPVAFSLFHGWYQNVKPNLMANNALKYKRLDAELREQKRKAWNEPIIEPLMIIFVILILMILPGVFTYIKKEHHSAKGGQ
jgi:ABC-type transport system substrate-binding protein